MLAANVCTADFIQQSKHPGLFRVHEGPTPEKKEILRSYLKAIGVGLTISDDPKPAEFQRIAEATKERPDAQQIHTHAAALDAAGDLHADQQRPLRPGVRRLHALHQPDPPLSRPAGAPRDQGDPATASATSCRRCRRPARPTRSWRAGWQPARQGAEPEAEEAGRRAEPRAAGLGSRGPALQRQRAPRRRGQPRRRSLAQVQVHARAPRRGILRRRHGGDELRHLRHARRRCTSRAWCTSPNWAASTSSSTRRARSCAASAPASAMPSARGVRVQVSRVDLDGRKIDFRLVREGEELIARAMKDKGVPAPRRRAGKPQRRRARQEGRRRASQVADPGPEGGREEGCGQDQGQGRKPPALNSNNKRGDDDGRKQRQRVAIVTGGGTGVGKAAALALLGDGWRSRWRAAAPRRCRRWSTESGAGEQRAGRADRRDGPGVGRSLVRRDGRRAGAASTCCSTTPASATPRRRSRTCALEDWKRVVDTNLNGMFYACSRPSA